MHFKQEKQNKVTSFAGCLEVFKICGLNKEEYIDLGIYEVFEKANKLCEERNINPKEIVIDFQ